MRKAKLDWKLFIILGGLASLIACQRSQTMNDTPGTIDKAPAESGYAYNDYVEQTDEIENRIENTVEATQESLDKWEEQAKTANGDKKAEMDEAVEKVKVNLDMVAMQLDDLKAATAETWETAKTKLDDALSTLEDSIEEAREVFES